MGRAQTQKEERTELNKSLPIVYEVDGMPVKLTFQTVKELICRGQKHTPSDQEVLAFIEFCRYMRANPFVQDAHLIKYSADDPASFVVGVGYHRKKAEANEHYRGFQSGLILQTEIEEVVDGKTIKKKVIERREGGFILDDEELLGGWCKVYRDDRDYPIKSEVNLKRYQKMRWDKDEKKYVPQALWKSNDADMIIKVAESQSHRKAFSELRAAYAAEEFREAPGVIDVEALISEEEQKTTEQLEGEFLDFLREKEIDFEEKPMIAYISHLAEALELDVAATYQRALDNLKTGEGLANFKAKYEKWLSRQPKEESPKEEQKVEPKDSEGKTSGEDEKTSQEPEEGSDEGKTQDSGDDSPGFSVKDLAEKAKDIPEHWFQMWWECRGLDLPDIEKELADLMVLETDAFKQVMEDLKAFAKDRKFPKKPPQQGLFNEEKK